MLSKSKLLVSVIGLSLGTMVAPAYSACTQADIAGTWQAYSVGATANGGYWVQCRVSVNSNGTIANNTCIDSGNNAATMTNGKVTLTSSARCTYTGNFRLGGALNTIRHATLAKSKTTAEGVGVFPGGVFRFSLTKL